MSVNWLENNERIHAQRMAETYNNGTGKTIVEQAQNHHLALCAKHIQGYEERINSDKRFSDIVDRQVFEDREYKRAMMHGVYAQAEAATRQAEVMESLLETVVELIGGTDLIDALLQWGYKQKAG